MLIYIKLFRIFSKCEGENVTDFIVGPLGCGAYKNPISEVANAFEVICTMKLWRFRIHFCCIEDHNSRSSDIVNLFSRVMNGLKTNSIKRLYDPKFLNHNVN